MRPQAPRDAMETRGVEEPVLQERRRMDSQDEMAMVRKKESSFIGRRS